jgi:hypothetical protein
MIKNEIFNKEFRGLLCPYSFEFLNNLLGLLNYSYNRYDDDKTREEILSILRVLFELRVLYVYKWFAKPELDKINLTIDETLEHIDKIWFKGAKYPDFYGMLIFGNKDWYVEKLKEKGLTETIDWEWFLDNQIPDLEKWIEENRPKK